MARKSLSKGMSALDKMYAKIAMAKKAARVVGKGRWRKGTEFCATDTVSKRPCTTEYKSKSGMKIKVRTSRTASFGMPKRLASLAHLRGIPGVAVPRGLKKRFKFKKRGSRGLGRRVSPGRRRKHVSAGERGRQALFAAARRISTGRV